MTGASEVNLVLALSLLLTAGFALGRLATLAHLPSVMGYLVAGIALGPSGLNVMGDTLLEGRLEIFTNIALMLVAFGIGERFDLQQLRPSARALARVSAGESLGTSCWLPWVWGLLRGPQARAGRMRDGVGGLRSRWSAPPSPSPRRPRRRLR